MMTQTEATELVIPNNEGQQIAYPPKLLEVIRKTVAKDATDEELFMFLSLAQKYGLDPFAKEIWFVKYEDKKGNVETRIETARDGYLTIAKRDEGFLGVQSFAVHTNDKFELTVKKGEVVDVEHSFRHVDRGSIVGAWAVAKHVNGNLYEYLPFSESNLFTPIWKKHPSLMMKKVVESVVLKRIAGISGLVTAEEMGTDVEQATIAIDNIQQTSNHDEIPQNESVPLPEKPEKAKKVVNSKPKMQEFKGQGKPVKAENVPKIFKLSKDLEEKFGPVWDAGEDIPNILLRKEAHALVKSETLDDKRFKQIMELSK